MLVCEPLNINITKFDTNLSLKFKFFNNENTNCDELVEIFEEFI